MPITLANPTPLGLVVFGVSTILLSITNIGLVAGGSIIMAHAMLLAGLVMMLAGIMDFIKGDTFGCVVFTSFAGFWMSEAAFEILPVLGWSAAPTPGLLGSFMFVWGIFTVLLLFGVFKGGVGTLLTWIMTLLAILLLILAVAYWTESEIVLKLAGWEGLVLGAFALYLGAAITVEETAKRKILPYS
jgi:succinate-acetate transporter protein